MKKQELKQVIAEEIKNIINEQITIKSGNVKKELTNHINEFLENIYEYIDIGNTDTYSDEFDDFMTEISQLINKLLSIVKSYSFKSIK